MQKVYLGILIFFIGLLSGCVNFNGINSAAITQKKQFQLVKQAGQTTLIIPGTTLFKLGSAKLNPSSYQLLIRITRLLQKNYPSANFKVAAYTDSSGKPSRNHTLTILRARAVAGYLRYRGIHRDKLEAVGFADSQPIASNETAEGREKNRRIVITIIN